MRLGGPEELIIIMNNTPAILRHVTAPPGSEALRRRPSDDAWSPIEIAGHLLDTEQIELERIALIQAEDTPLVESVDERAMVEAANYQDQSMDEVLSTFESLRAQRINLLESLDESVWERSWHFAGFGPVTLEQHTGHLCKHDVVHITQILEGLDEH